MKPSELHQANRRGSPTIGELTRSVSRARLCSALPLTAVVFGALCPRDRRVYNRNPVGRVSRAEYPTA